MVLRQRKGMTTLAKWKMTDAILKRLVARIKKQISENPQGVQFTAVRIFREALEAEECRAYDAIRMLNNKDSLRALTRRQTWQVLSWCSSYRPAPSHFTVRNFGNLIDE